MIALGSDHAGLPLKLEIIELLKERGIAYEDFGTHTLESCDYPVYAKKAAQAVADGRCRKGLVFCGTGIGVGITANKVHGVRCAICSDCYSAVLSRNHNDCNMLALGARVVGVDLAWMIVSMWLGAGFEGGRHQRRVDLIMQAEGEG